MPRIPGVEYASKVPGVVSSGNVTVSPVRDTSGQGLVELGGIINQLGTEMKDMYQKSQASNELATAQKRLQDFSFDLKYGKVNPETGERDLPAAPDQHEELYTQEVQKISEQAGRNLKGQAIAMFDSEFRPYSARQELAVKTYAIEQYQSKIKANSDESLNTFANNFVNADKDYEKESIKISAFGKLDSLVAQGVYSPEEGLARKRKFIDDAETGSFMKLISQDPMEGVRLIDMGGFENLPPDKRQQLRQQAISLDYTNTVRENAEAEREIRQREKLEKTVWSNNAKDLWTAAGEGKLKPSMVTQMKDSLSLEEYKALLKESKGGTADHDDPMVLHNLEIKAAQGFDVREETTRALINGLITGPSRNRLFDKWESNSVAAKAGNPQMLWEKYIVENLAVNPNAPTGFEKYQLSTARVEFSQWLKARPNATAEEIEIEAKRIVKSRAVLQSNEIMSAIPLPKYHKGGRDTMDLNAVNEDWLKLRKAFKKKQITPEEFNREKKNLNNWKKLLNKVEAAKDQKAGSK